MLKSVSMRRLLPLQTRLSQNGFQQAGTDDLSGMDGNRDPTTPLWVIEVLMGSLSALVDEALALEKSNQFFGGDPGQAWAQAAISTTV